MGSLVAFDLAARYPDELTLVMAGTSTSMPVGSTSTVKDDLTKRNGQFCLTVRVTFGGSQVPGTWMIGKLQRLLERAVLGNL